MKAIVLGLKTDDSLIVVSLLVLVALPEGHRHPIHDLSIEGQVLQDGGELLFEHFLARIRLRAPSLETGAVVDVAPLLDLCHKGAAAVPAGDEAGESEIVLGLAPSLREATVKDGLCLVPKIWRDEPGVDAVVGLPVPVEVSRVDAVTQYLVHGGLRDGISALAEDHAAVACHLGDVPDRVVARYVPLEDARDERGHFGVRLDGPLAVWPSHVAVTERGIARPDALLGLLQHSLPGFFGEVVDVVLGHQHLDAVHELLGRARVVGENYVLLDEVDLQAQIVDGYPVLEVAVEAVGLLYQEDAARSVLPQEGDHLAESASSGLFGRLNIHEFADHGETRVGSVAAEEL